MKFIKCKGKKKNIPRKFESTLLSFPLEIVINVINIKDIRIHKRATVRVERFGTGCKSNFERHRRFDRLFASRL